MFLGRRFVVGSLIAAMAALGAACAGATPTPPGPTLSKVTITQAVDSLAFLPIYVARAQGFFEAEGLDVQQISTRGGGPDLQALIAGDAEFNAGAGPYQLNAFRQGQNVIGVFNFLNKNIINVAIRKEVAAERGITENSPLKDKLAALKGLNIGITRPGSLTWLQARYMARQAGLDVEKDVNIVGIGGGSALVAALENKQVDVIVISSPNAEIAVDRGFAIMLVNNTKGEDPSLVPFMMENVYVRPTFAKTDPEAVGAFVRAMQKANRWILDNSAADATDVIQNFFPKIDREVLLASVGNVRGAVNPTGVLDREAVANTLKMMGITDVKVDDVFKLYTGEFIE